LYRVCYSVGVPSGQRKIIPPVDVANAAEKDVTMRNCVATCLSLFLSFVTPVYAETARPGSKAVNIDVWDLLQSVGIIVDPGIKNDILRKTIDVTGTDGYVTVFTAGEIAPNFGGNQVLVVYEVDGQPIGADGPAEIVAPGD
jgi:hypothetical protein